MMWASDGTAFAHSSFYMSSGEFSFVYYADNQRGCTMHQDKDRGSKWLIENFGDAILKLAGYRDFQEWKLKPPEVVAPRRFPDGLMQVRFAGQSELTLVLVEIESYPNADADR